MDLTAFARKHATIAKRHGPLTAATMASQEVVLRALEPLASKKATPIWADEWDVCLVLDACRFDLWQEVTESDSYGGESANGVVHTHAWPQHSKWSVGSASLHWINETFAERHRSDWEQAAYVTANPFSGKQGDEIQNLDSAVYPLADRGLGYLDDVWRDAWPMDDGLPTVDPATLTERGFHAYQNADVDRTVVHYMQPHIPFKKRPEWFGGWGGTQDFGEPGNEGDSKDTWLRVRDDELLRDEVLSAYAANLEWVLQEVQRWYEGTDARILVTSDHGNALGEWGQWSHPPYSANPVLRKVPWVTVEGIGENDLPTQTPPEHSTPVNVDERLEALGYR